MDALGKRAGPEDIRSTDQRHHDAVEEACRRLIASGCLPDRAGQPIQVQLNITLDELARGAGNPPTGAARTGPAWLAPAAGPGDDCDAAIAPVVTGNLDQTLLDQLAARLVGSWAEYTPGPACDHADADAAQCSHLSRAAARELVLTRAIALLSGPGGLAAWLRGRQLTGPAASISLPLDVGTVAETIPPHLRRTVIRRDKHCAAPDCDQPPAACHVHHVVPRSQGGATELANLILLCSFHHLILVHRWGWTITLNPDGTTTMTSPDGRAVHSHSPPQAAAAA